MPVSGELAITSMRLEVGIVALMAYSRKKRPSVVLGQNSDARLFYPNRPFMVQGAERFADATSSACLGFDLQVHTVLP